MQEYERDNQTAMRKQMLEDFERLSPALQARARDLVHGLRIPKSKGATVDDLQPLIGILDEDSARQMKEAIAEGCGRGIRDEG